MVFGGIGSGLSRIVYALIGLAALYSLSFYAKLDSTSTDLDGDRHRVTETSDYRDRDHNDRDIL